MRQTIKKILWFVGLVFSLQSVWAFSLLGPVDNGPSGRGDTWQVTQNGFNPINSVVTQSPINILDPLTPGTGPKNLGEEYRRNTPFIFYAPDASFLDYFGSNGAVALDNAFVILNNVFTNTPAVRTYGLDGFSAGLTEFPLASQSTRYLAQGMGLLDLKSETLALMMEQLGLADSVRYTWTLHDRYLPPNAACVPYYPVLGAFGIGGGMEYMVVQRNFDITATPLNQLQYSAYVNGELFNYTVLENCAAPAASVFADAVEVPPVPLPQNAPVASGGWGSDEAPLVQGNFYTGLTRDDVAGLRYLLSTNNINYEDTAPGSLLISSASGGTNIGAPFVLYTSNYTDLFLTSQVTDPATLVNLFPGLVVSSTLTNFAVVSTPVLGTALVPLIGAPAGWMQLVIVTNGFNTTVVTNYTDTFANVILTTNSFRTSTSVRIYITSAGPVYGAPAGTLGTNTSFTTFVLTNVASGDYYILTNPCGPHVILSTLLTNVVATTNLLFTATNSQGFSVTENLVTYATNHVFIAEPIVCASGGTSGQANVSGLYQGIGRMQFVRANFDSLLGQFFHPITNVYTMVAVTNSLIVRQTFQRILTQPDIQFSAADLANVSGETLTVPAFGRTPFNFDTAHILPGLAGPGTINSPSTITFDKVGPVYDNSEPGAINNYGMNGPNNNRNFIWGSFDGSTNDPIVYPNGSSIQNLASQILIQISSTPSTLPDATNNQAYSAAFTATGGQTPYTWSLESGTQLPQNLILSPNGVISGVVDNSTNTPPGVYVFTVQLTDSANRTESLNYFITVH